MEGLKRVLALAGGMILEALVLAGRVLTAPLNLLKGRSRDEPAHDIHETRAEKRSRHEREKENEAKFQRRLIIFVSLLVIFLVVISMQGQDKFQKVINGEGFTLEKESKELPEHAKPKPPPPPPPGASTLKGSGSGMPGAGEEPQAGASGQGEDRKPPGSGGEGGGEGEHAAGSPAASDKTSPASHDGASGQGAQDNTSGQGTQGGAAGTLNQKAPHATPVGEPVPPVVIAESTTPVPPALSGRLEVVNVTLGTNKRNEQSVLGQVVNGTARAATRIVVTVGFLDTKGKVIAEKRVDPLVVSGGLFGDVTAPLPSGESRAFELGVLPAPKGWSNKVTTAITLSEFAP